jgi:hypothetical protein
MKIKKEKGLTRCPRCHGAIEAWPIVIYSVQHKMQNSQCVPKDSEPSMKVIDVTTVPTPRTTLVAITRSAATDVREMQKDGIQRQS